MPDELASYAALKHLDLSFNRLTTIPESLSECTRLTTLVLKNNMLEDGDWPKDWGRLTSLREVNLSGNDLTRIPEPVFHLSSSLVSLHLGANRIRSLPREIATLSKLQVG